MLKVKLKEKTIKIFFFVCHYNSKDIRRRQLNYLLYGQSGELFLSLSVGKVIIIILSFRVDTSKNKNVDNCRFPYQGNCELLRGQNLEEAMFVYIHKWEIGYDS